MSKKNFDIYDYVHNNKFELKVENKKKLMYLKDIMILEKLTLTK